MHVPLPRPAGRAARAARAAVALARWLVAVLAGWAMAGPAHAATWTVGAGTPLPTLAEAIRRAGDDDTIELLPGEYRGDVAVITQRRLTIRGRGERPVLLADGRHAEGKAILVVRNGDITIENLAFRGARVPDHNGAGIRFERGRLTVRRCGFFDNEHGILTANIEDAELRIEDSVFAQAPHDELGLHHLLYVGRIARLSVTGSRFHEGWIGHLIKSRARESLIAYNLILDGPQGRASYEIDLPNGGDARVIGNVIGQSAGTSNPVVVAYGAEGAAWPDSRLQLAHNTMLSDRATGAWFLRVWNERLPAQAAVRAVNNLTVGLGVLSLGARGRFDGNFPATAGMLVDPAGLAFELRPDALLRGRGVNPRMPGETDLTPRAEFALPIGTRPIGPPGQAPAAWSPGAFQR